MGFQRRSRSEASLFPLPSFPIGMPPPSPLPCYCNVSLFPPPGKKAEEGELYLEVKPPPRTERRDFLSRKRRTGWFYFLDARFASVERKRRIVTKRIEKKKRKHACWRRRRPRYYFINVDRPRSPKCFHFPPSRIT